MADESDTPAAPRPARIHAVPWKTSTEEKVKSALGEVPAYIRRARRTEDAMDRLFRATAEVREEFLEIVSLRLRELLNILSEEIGRALPEATLQALGGILDVVDEHPAFLRLTAKPQSPRGEREVEAAIGNLRSSVDRFNGRYARWLREEAPLDEVNEEIRGYNENYSFERQCALRYVPLDKVQFKPKALLTESDILARFPLLPRP